MSILNHMLLLSFFFLLFFFVCMVRILVFSLKSLKMIGGIGEMQLGGGSVISEKFEKIL